MTPRFDYVVIGAGSAGCAVAGRLSERGHTVLLVEAGGKASPLLMRMPAGVYSIYRDKRFNWGYTSERHPDLDARQFVLPRGRVVGGSSAINALVYLRGHPEDYNGWARQGMSDWDFEHCLPYFRSMEASDLGPNRYRGGEGPIAVRQGRMVSPIFDAFIQGASEAGYPISDDLNAAQPEGMGRFDANVRNGVRCSAADGYVRPALKRGKLTLLPKALVKKVVIEGGRAIGVSIVQHGQERVVYAEREVVLSAGAYNSPKLLMLSGIGPADHLKALGIKIEVDVPGVGGNLQDHLQILHQFRIKTVNSMAWVGSLSGRVTSGAQWLLNHTGPLASNMYEMGGFFRSETAISYPDLQYHLLPMVIDERGGRMRLTEGFTLSITSLRPKSRGEVRLASADPDAPPILDMNYLSDRRDFTPFATSIDHTRQLVAQPGLARIIDGEITPWLAYSSLSEVTAAIARNATTIHHPCGTCRMGLGADAVVDGDLRVRGVSNLRVIDASIMPNLVSANTNCASIMIGEKGAARLLQ